MKNVVVLRAISGAGKSTHAKRLTDIFVSAHKGEDFREALVRIVSADHYFERNGRYVYEPDQIGNAHAICFKAYLEALERLSDPALLVVDNTNIHMNEIAPYMLAASAYGWTAEIHEIHVPLEVAAARTIHGVPRDVINNMYAQLLTQRVPPWWTVRRYDVSGDVARELL
jgi:predicted kinase